MGLARAKAHEERTVLTLQALPRYERDSRGIDVPESVVVGKSPFPSDREL